MINGKNFSAEFSKIDWPLKDNIKGPFFANVSCFDARRLWGYKNNEVVVFSCKDEMLFNGCRKDFKHALVVWHENRDEYVVQCWFDNKGNRKGSIGRSDFEIQQIKKLPRFIYVISSTEPTDKMVYVGQSVNPKARWSSHKSKARCCKKQNLEQEWCLWMAKIMKGRFDLQFYVIDAIVGTAYEAQTLEYIWRLVFRLNSYLPYQSSDRNYEILDHLIDTTELPLYIQVRHVKLKAMLVNKQIKL